MNTTSRSTEPSTFRFLSATALRAPFRSLICLLLLCGCTSKPEPDKTDQGAQGEIAAPTGSKSTAEDAVVKSKEALDAWVAAQNGGKLEAYLALYDAGSFRGVKRTAGGGEQTYTFDKWKEERSRMLAGSTVAADDRKVLSWMEKPGLQEGIVEARFTQRWKNARYADHGQKVIQFNVSGGNARIVYEEMVSSQPGWDDASTDVSRAKFVRARPATNDVKGLDACVYLGGFGFACLNALVAERSPVVRRYMRRLSDASARHAFDSYQRNQMGGPPHAELGVSCAESGPCGASPERSDDGYACLTKAEAAMERKDMGEAKAAHARACQCSAERAQIPIMGGFLACDGATPVERGKNLTSEQAVDVRACGECDASRGPAACAKEIAGLSQTDPEVAKYIETVHVPRCSRP